MARYARMQVDTQGGLTAAQLGELFALHEQVGYFFFFKEPPAKVKTEGLPEIQLEKARKAQAKSFGQLSTSIGSKQKWSLGLRAVLRAADGTNHQSS